MTSRPILIAYATNYGQTANAPSIPNGNTTRGGTLIASGAAGAPRATLYRTSVIKRHHQRLPFRAWLGFGSGSSSSMLRRIQSAGYNHTR